MITQFCAGHAKVGSGAGLGRGRQGAGGGHPETAGGFWGCGGTRPHWNQGRNHLPAHMCTWEFSRVCVYAHSMRQSREKSNPLELLDCLSCCFIYLPLAMPRSGLNPAHFLRAIIPHDGGMSVLLGEATRVSGQCSHVYMCVPLCGHVCAPLCTSVPLCAHVYKVLQVCSSLCIHEH